MARAESRADVRWQGDLLKGSGTVKVESGAFSEQPVTWASRLQRAQGKTSPEELIAAAHASCYAMAFSNTLAQAGSAPTRLEISATCILEQPDGKTKITTIQLDVKGVVPGIDQARFEELARQGEQGCPVSNALRGNVDIQVKAQLLPQ